MRCSDARERILLASLGLLDTRGSQALAAHCRTCDPCRAAMDGSRSLDRELQALRNLPAPPLDVRSRVLDQVGDLRPAGPSRWFGWAAAAAVTAVAGLGLLTVQLLPHALPLLRGGFHGGMALIRSAAPLATLGSALTRLGWLAMRPFLALAESWSALQPLTFTLLAVSTSLALAISLIVVGRSFLGEPPAVVRKEP